MPARARRGAPACNPHPQLAIEDGIAWITLDDGKVNALSRERIDEIGAALDAAESAAAVAVLRGREGIFSAGFDLTTFQRGPQASLEMVRRGRAADPAPARLSAPGAHGLHRSRLPDGGLPDAVGGRAPRPRGPLADRDERGRDRAHGPEVRRRAGAPSPDAARLRADHDGGHVRPGGGAARSATSTGCSRRTSSRARRAEEASRLRALDRPSFAATKARINERALQAVRAAVDDELRSSA